jgi:hypothetical protein
MMWIYGAASEMVYKNRIREPQRSYGRDEKAPEDAEQYPKTARQMDVLATNEIHLLTSKKTGSWDNSIHSEVHPQG